MVLTQACRTTCSQYFRSSKAFLTLSCRYLQFHRMASTLPNLAIFRAIAKHDPVSPAIVHGDSRQSFFYGSLLQDVVAAKEYILQTAGGSPLQGERIAFLAENSYDYVGMYQNHAIWTLLILPQSHFWPSLPMKPSLFLFQTLSLHASSDISWRIVRLEFFCRHRDSETRRKKYCGQAWSRNLCWQSPIP